MTKSLEQQIQEMEVLLTKKYIHKITKDKIRSVIKTLKLIKKHYASGTSDNIVVSMSKGEWKQHSKQRKF